MAVAIILAGGKGSRMNSDVAKQYMNICGKEVIYYSLKVFSESNRIQDIILVTREEDIEYCQKSIVNKYGFAKVSKIVAGGKERYDSVYSGISAIENTSDGIVMIHDGARPFVSEDIIERSIAAVVECGACTVGVPVKDTIKIVNENNIGISTPDRKKLYQIQTPQTFRYEYLKSAYEKMYQDKNHNITDDTMLLEQYIGVRSKVIFGAYENIKITTPEDLDIAEKFIEKNSKNVLTM